MNFASRIFAEHAARRAQAETLSETLDSYSMARGISLCRAAQENARTARDFADRAAYLGQAIETALPALARASGIPLAKLDPADNDYYDTRHKELAAIQMVNGWSYAFMRVLGACALIPIRKLGITLP